MRDENAATQTSTGQPTGSVTMQKPLTAISCALNQTLSWSPINTAMGTVGVVKMTKFRMLKSALPTAKMKTRNPVICCTPEGRVQWEKF